MLPCAHKELHAVTGRYTKDQCPACWHYLNTPAYRARWDGTATAGPAVPPPSFLQRAVHFAGALTRHALDGCRKRTEDEIAAVLEICKACEKFNGQGCNVCGCNCSGQQVFMNKLAWASEHCPLGKWHSYAPAQIVGKKWSVLVTTCPVMVNELRSVNGRPARVITDTIAGHRETLPLCLDSLLQAGWTRDEITVYAEPQSIVPDEINVVWREKRFDLWPNLMDGSRRELEKSPDLVMWVDDDTVFEPDTKRWIEQNAWPSDAGLISLFRMQAVQKRQPLRTVSVDELCYAGLVPHYDLVKRDEWPWGSNALVFPAETLARLVSAPPTLGGTPDFIVGKWIHAIDKTYWLVHESKAQHLVVYPAGHRLAGERVRSSRRDVPLSDNMTASNIPIAPEIPSPAPPISQSPAVAGATVEISAIIPACGLADLTKRCITHLRNSTVPVNVIYVDNGSDELQFMQVVSHLKGSGLRHTVVRNATNLGFTLAVNQGWALATGHILILSNDCFVEPTCIAELSGALHQKERLSAVNPRRGLQSAPFREVGMVPFYCTLIRREAADEIGDLDPYFADGLAADDDWCMRATRNGWRVGYVAAASAPHIGKSTFRALGIACDNATAYGKLMAKHRGQPRRAPMVNNRHAADSLLPRRNGKLGRERFTIFLLSFNRYEWLRDLAKQCERFAGADIHIVDNGSTWRPLLEWLEVCPYQVHRGHGNLGHRAVWQLDLPQKATNYYVVSDPDLDISGVPDYALMRLCDGLDTYSWAASAGLSLEIDDLPDAFPLKQKVVAHESQFWKSKLSLYWWNAKVDTTFAMYRRGEQPSYGTRRAMRADRPLTARHLPWYIGLAEMTEQDRHYYRTSVTQAVGSMTLRLLPLLKEQAVI